ncbi:MAG: peptidoglycan synthetase [Saprospiraceae bacterium]|nr:peptidoglycan synthetase [Saprospiraceae bacterium]
MSRIHLIAIGGSVMHNLALELARNGHDVSGSDDQIFDPARTKLAARNLLPAQEGWFPEKITSQLDLIILGMHAKRDNPELAAALALKIPVYSFPEFVQHSYRDKMQIVVTGSHGKTTTTSMIMHMFRENGLEFDYLVGSQLDGFELMVRISDAPMAVIEGDEYLSSCLDPRPKFMHYTPQILIVTGVAWDHFNVFPSYESYLDAFRQRLLACDQETRIIYCEGDPELKSLLQTLPAGKQLLPYRAAPHVNKDSVTYLLHEDKEFPLQVFGNHNLENMQAALLAASMAGLDPIRALQSLTSFKGAAKRLECIYRDGNRHVYRDFAHAPSKLKASLSALKEKHDPLKILAVVELHTYSSLNPEFLPHYFGAADAADKLIIYVDQRAMEIKGMPALSPLSIESAFGHRDMNFKGNSIELEHSLQAEMSDFDILVFAGSGHFGNLDLSNYYQRS